MPRDPRIRIFQYMCLRIWQEIWIKWMRYLILGDFFSEISIGRSPAKRFCRFKHAKPKTLQHSCILVPIYIIASHAHRRGPPSSSRWPMRPRADGKHTLHNSSGTRWERRRGCCTFGVRRVGVCAGISISELREHIV